MQSDKKVKDVEDIVLSLMKHSWFLAQHPPLCEIFITEFHKAGLCHPANALLSPLCFSPLLFQNNLYFFSTAAPSAYPQKPCAPPCSFTSLRYVKRQGEVATRKGRLNKNSGYF